MTEAGTGYIVAGYSICLGVLFLYAVYLIYRRRRATRAAALAERLPSPTDPTGVWPSDAGPNAAGTNAAGTNVASPVGVGAPAAPDRAAGAGTGGPNDGGDR